MLDGQGKRCKRANDKTEAEHQIHQRSHVLLVPWIGARDGSRHAERPKPAGSCAKQQEHGKEEEIALDRGTLSSYVAEVEHGDPEQANDRPSEQ